MAIDLSKIPAREVPVKKDEIIRICGVEQTCDIRPLTGEGALEEWATQLGNERETPEAVKHRVLVNLKYGAGLTVEQCADLIRLDWDAALTLAAKVMEFTAEYNRTLAEERDKAEKNLQKADSPATPS